jgi:hypothetical protein
VPDLGDLAALVVIGGSEADFLCGPVQPDHFAEAVAEMVPARLGEIIQLVPARIHAAGRDGVQERLPQVHARPVD